MVKMLKMVNFYDKKIFDSYLFSYLPKLILFMILMNKIIILYYNEDAGQTNV